MAACATAPPGTGVAGPASEVASAFDDGDSIDIHLSLGYGFELARAAIQRERAGLPGTAETDPVPVLDDLVFAGARHTLTPRLAIGIFPDFSLYAALPVVLSQTGDLSLDQIDQINQVDATSSSTVMDGLLPETGFDAATGGDISGNTIFRGARRSGLDQVHLGVAWALMSQERDDTKPIWKLGAEARLAVGDVMQLDRAAPGSNTAVGRGISEVKVWTSIARRMGRAEPFVELWWLAPLATADDSPYADLGFGQTRSPSQQQAGVHMGIETTLVDEPGSGRRIALSLAGRLDAHFEGRAHSPMWEVFQYAGTAGMGGPLVLDRDPATEGVQELTHPGVSNVENYLGAGGSLGLDIRLGAYVHLGAAFELMAAQGHYISFADAGIDLPTCSDTVTTGCETERNDLVNPNTQEVNPAYVPLVDQVGQRYRAAKNAVYAMLFHMRMLF